jgi:hypothetical protein
MNANQGLICNNVLHNRSAFVDDPEHPRLLLRGRYSIGFVVIILSMIENHLLALAKQVPSPNYNERPNGEVLLVVIHNISLPPKEFGNDYIEQFFTNKLDFGAHPYFQTLIGIEVSTHLFIKRDGEIVQFVPFDKRAWHANCLAISCSNHSHLNTIVFKHFNAVSIK